MKRSTYITLTSAALLGLQGCHASPNVEIIGSYFPAWMISLVIAVVATVLIHLAARRNNVVEALEPAVLVYTSIALIIACAIWLVVFA